MASGWTSEEISKPLPSGWTANPDGQTCYLSAGFFSFFRRRAPVEQAMFSSNCDHLQIYVDGKLVAEADPDREQFPHLRYAPFTVDLSKAVSSWGDLRVEGYMQDRQLIVKSFSGKAMDQAFEVLPDDALPMAPIQRAQVFASPIRSARFAPFRTMPSHSPYRATSHRSATTRSRR